MRIVQDLVVFIVIALCFARRLEEWGQSLPDGPHSLTHSVGIAPIFMVLIIVMQVQQLSTRNKVHIHFDLCLIAGKEFIG